MTQSESTPTFTLDDFSRLTFLAGRWRGVGPDGATFYELYDFADPGTFRSRRYADAGFDSTTDGSTVTFEDGVVTARWGPYTWTAVELGPTRASFVPASAPSAFSWERASDSTVRVTQRWTDEAGAEQQYSLVLERVPG